MKDFKQCWEAEVCSVTLLSLYSVSVCTNITPKALSSNLFPSPTALLANPNQDLIVISHSFRPNTSQPYSPSPPQSLSPPAHLCSFLTLFPDSAEPNTALGDAEHTALQTVAVSSGSNMLEVSIVAELSQPQQAASSCWAPEQSAGSHLQFPGVRWKGRRLPAQFTYCVAGLSED